MLHLPRSLARARTSDNHFFNSYFNKRLFSFFLHSLERPVGKVLERVVQLGGERVDGLLDHGVDQRVQLVLGEVHVEAGLHVLHGQRAGREAGKLRA